MKTHLSSLLFELHSLTILLPLSWNTYALFCDDKFIFFTVDTVECRARNNDTVKLFASEMSEM